MANTPCCTARPSYVALLLLGLYVPRAHPLKSSEIGEAIKCELCGVVSRDLFKASIGIQGAGFGPTGFKFKDQYGAGDLIDVVQSICHIEATPDWDEEAQGLPPVALSHGYVLWQNPADGRYTPRRKDDVDESLLGWSMVEAREASDVMFHACEHIRSMDLDVAEQFSVVLRKHRNALKRATVEVDYGTWLVATQHESNSSQG
eukprot:COSAG05_NODE_26_length_29797_cov_35.911139_17_plen_203_part_00